MAKIKKHPGGRPTTFTPGVVQKLEEAFAMDCSVEEACLYADIARQTYYNHVNNKAPEKSKAKQYFDRFEELRQRPFLKARQTIFESLDQPEHAKWYMERKKKLEFSSKSELDVNNPDGNLKTIIINKNTKPKEEETTTEE